jgi:hypothetical protein
MVRILKNISIKDYLVENNMSPNTPVEKIVTKYIPEADALEEFKKLIPEKALDVVSYMTMPSMATEIINTKTSVPLVRAYGIAILKDTDKNKQYEGKPHDEDFFKDFIDFAD